MCKAIAKSFLIFFNGLSLLLGLAIVGVASYVIHQHNSNGMFGDSETLDWAIYVPLGVGLLIVIMAAVNCAVSASENRCGLGVFGFLQLLFFLLLALVGGFMLAYDSYMHNVAYTPVNRLKPGIGDSQHMLYDYTLGVFDRCCEPLSPAPERCPAPGNTIYDYCLFEMPSDPYNAGRNASKDLCSALHDSEQLNWCNGQAGSRTIAPTTSASQPNSPSTAPAGSPTLIGNGEELHQFQVAWYSYAHDAVFIGGLLFMIFAGVLLLAGCMSCCVACSKSKKDKYEQVGEKEHAKRAREAQKERDALTMA